VSYETDFVVNVGDICEKIQALRHEYVLLKHYTFQRTLKKIRGNIGPKLILILEMDVKLELVLSTATNPMGSL